MKIINLKDIPPKTIYYFNNTYVSILDRGHTFFFIDQENQINVYIPDKDHDIKVMFEFLSNYHEQPWQLTNWTKLVEMKDEISKTPFDIQNIKTSYTGVFNICVGDYSSAKPMHVFSFSNNKKFHLVANNYPGERMTFEDSVPCEGNVFNQILSLFAEKNTGITFAFSPINLAVPIKTITTIPDVIFKKRDLYIFSKSIHDNPEKNLKEFFGVSGYPKDTNPFSKTIGQSIRILTKYPNIAELIQQSLKGHYFYSNIYEELLNTQQPSHLQETIKEKITEGYPFLHKQTPALTFLVYAWVFAFLFQGRQGISSKRVTEEFIEKPGTNAKKIKEMDCLPSFIGQDYSAF